MRVLLDTHVFLWLALGDKRATHAIRARVEAATAVYVSTASVWEVAIKHALGKIDGDPREFKNAIGTFGFEELTIQSEHVIAIAALPAIHKDPFDRLLIAQAISEPLRLITSDALLSEYSELVVVV